MTDGHSASLSWCQPPQLGPNTRFCYYHTVAGLWMWSALSDDRTGLSFIIVAAESRQRSHSKVRVSRDSLPYFPVSISRLRHPGGPGPRIYIPQEQGGPVYTSGNWVPSSPPPTTRRTTVEVFDPASTSSLCNLGMEHI
jgi:hypothetical protein